MKISLFTAGFSKYPIERAFEAAKKFGYDGIEIAGTRPDAYPLDILNGFGEKIINLSEKYELPIVSYAPENTGSPHSLVYENKELNEESLTYFKRSLDAAKEIGSKYCMLAVNHPGYSRNREDVKKLLINNFKILADYAEKIEQVIILEPVTPYEGTLVCNSDDVYWALNEVNSEYFKAMLDLACPLTCNEPISEYFEKLGTENIKHIHFIDAESTSEDHLIPGDGEMDFPNIIRYLKEIGYDGYLSLELFSRYENEPYFAARRGIDVISNLLKEY